MKTVTVIHCWSAPRSRSTALLYSFEARGGSDCVAIDEPLYREWLVSKGDTVERPYFQELVQGKPPTGSPPEETAIWQRELASLDDRIRQAVQGSFSSTSEGGGDGAGDGVIFCKHMAKHFYLYNLDQECTVEGFHLVHRHLLLIRDPVSVLSSWGAAGEVHGNNPTSDEIGIVPLLSIYSQLESRVTKDFLPAVVLDSDDLVVDPEGTLMDICVALNIPYRQEMMSWPKGPHSCDGPWSHWWYKNVHKSQGWQRTKAISTKEYYPETREYRTLDPSLMQSLKASFPAYEFLKHLSRGYQQRGPDPSTTTIYEDPRNAHLLVWIGSPQTGRLYPRDMAGVSPWDSAVQGGDACWEGLRVYRGKVLSLEKHLRRLFRSARALGFEISNTNVHSIEQVREAIFRTLAANGMRDSAHIRLTLTRGEKCTSSMNPKFNVYGTTLIILPEWKPTEVRVESKLARDGCLTPA
jgi:protein-lysine N-methyltransferase EEF2KMT